MTCIKSIADNVRQHEPLVAARRRVLQFPFLLRDRLLQAIDQKFLPQSFDIFLVLDDTDSGILPCSRVHPVGNDDPQEHVAVLRVQILKDLEDTLRHYILVGNVVVQDHDALLIAEHDQLVCRISEQPLVDLPEPVQLISHIYRMISPFLRNDHADLLVRKSIVLDQQAADQRRLLTTLHFLPVICKIAALVEPQFESPHLISSLNILLNARSASQVWSLHACAVQVYSPHAHA